MKQPVKPFAKTKFRRLRSPLIGDPHYDITNPAVFSAYHVERVALQPEEVAELFARAEIRARQGSHYVPLDEDLRARRYSHLW